MIDPKLGGGSLLDMYGVSLQLHEGNADRAGLGDPTRPSGRCW